MLFFTAELVAMSKKKDAHLNARKVSSRLLRKSKVQYP